MQKKSCGSVKVFSPRYTRLEVIRRLRAEVPALRRELPVTRLVLFGSYATGRYTPASDIDLLVVYAGASRPDAYTVVRKALDLRGLEPHVYSETEAAATADSIERMIRDGVVI